jgi:hypothetical protein
MLTTKWVVLWHRRHTRLRVSDGSRVICCQHTLIGVTGGTLVGLRSIVSLVQALVTSGDCNSVVSSQKPGLLSGSGVGLPDLGVHVVALGNTGIKGEVGTGDDDGSGPGGDVPSSSAVAVPGDELDTVGGLYSRRKRETLAISTGSDDSVGGSLLDGRAHDRLGQDGE